VLANSPAETVHHPKPLIIDLHQDARWIAESGCGAHFESLQFPAPDADRPAGRFEAAMYMEKSIMQHLNLPL
jgi:hypothetical protein